MPLDAVINHIGGFAAGIISQGIGMNKAPGIHMTRASGAMSVQGRCGGYNLVLTVFILLADEGLCYFRTD